MDQQFKREKNKGKRSKVACKQPRSLPKGIRKDPSQSPLHNYQDIYAGNSTDSPNWTKSPRDFEDIFTAKGRFWKPVRKLTPTGSTSSSSLPATPMTPMRDYYTHSSEIDLRAQQGISPTFASQMLQQILVHGENITLSSTSEVGKELDQPQEITAEHEITNDYEASTSAPQIAYKTPENQTEKSKDAPKRKRRSKGGKQPRRMFKCSIKILQEIKTYQKSTDFLIPQKPFQRLCREIFDRNFPKLRITPQALAALQEVSETHIVNTLEEGNRCALHASRVTIMPKDIQLAQRLKKC